MGKQQGEQQQAEQPKQEEQPTETATQDAGESEPADATASAGGFVPSVTQTAAGGNGQKAEAPTAQQPEVKTFDAADINAIVTERLRINDLCRPFPSRQCRP